MFVIDGRSSEATFYSFPAKVAVQAGEGVGKAWPGFEGIPRLHDEITVVVGPGRLPQPYR